MGDFKQLFDQAKVASSLLGKQFLLDNYVQEKKRPQKKGHGRPSFLIPADQKQYNLYLRMNDLWREYIDDLLGGKYTENNIQNKLLKADFHGAKILVWKAKCDGYIGLKGIVVHDTQRTFRIITPDNEVKTILKHDTIFLIKVGEKIVKLFGQNFQYRPADRVKVKWTQKYNLKLFG